MEATKEDFKNAGIKSWGEIARNRDGWSRIVKEIEAAKDNSLLLSLRKISS